MASRERQDGVSNVDYGDSFSPWSKAEIVKCLQKLNEVCLYEEDFRTTLAEKTLTLDGMQVTIKLESKPFDEFNPEFTPEYGGPQPNYFAFPQETSININFADPDSPTVITYPIALSIYTDKELPFIYSVKTMGKIYEGAYLRKAIEDGGTYDTTHDLVLPSDLDILSGLEITFQPYSEL